MKKIAVPVNDGVLSNHFGHCLNFDVFLIEAGKILQKEKLDPPQHEPGALPKFLAEHGVDEIISGGMGHRAQSLFQQNGIKVLIGAPCLKSEDLIKAYLDNNLTGGTNPCDH